MLFTIIIFISGAIVYTYSLNLIHYNYNTAHFLITNTCFLAVASNVFVKVPVTDLNRGFHKLDEIANNANIGIRGFTM